MRVLRQYGPPALIIATILWSALSAQADNLADAPLPDPSAVLDDTRRALVVEFIVRSGSAEMLDTYVSDTPPGTHVSDPAHLHIRWYAADGARIGSRNAWDPRWEFRRDETGEEMVLLPEQTAVLAIPFSPDIVTVSVMDVETGLVLLETDVRNTVQSFCSVAPDEPVCEGATSGDRDNDGIEDGVDNCPDTANPGQFDLDSDGAGDACDIDDDNDGVDDEVDNCPLTVNSNQADLDGDGSGDACDPDDDGDGIDDGADNCPTVTNPDQLDTDRDNLGDACDPDDDNDGYPDAADNCPLSANADQADFDGDGAGDICDPDIDGDTVSNQTDECPQTMVPELLVVGGRLLPNHWGLGTAGLYVQAAPAADAAEGFTAADTGGCSCAQIVGALQLGKGLTEGGCTSGVMRVWITGR